jgi:threonine dehydratase
MHAMHRVRENASISRVAAGHGRVQDARLARLTGISLPITHRIDTIADGIGVRVPIPRAVEDMRGLADDTVLVTEEATVRRTRLLHRRAGVVAEPSAAVGVTAILERPEAFRGRLVGTIVCEQLDRGADGPVAVSGRVDRPLTRGGQ